MRGQPSFRIKEKFTTWSPDVLVVVFVVAVECCIFVVAVVEQDQAVQDLKYFF